MSKSSLILSETRTPPVSSAAFQVSPQSLRSRTAEPSKPRRVLPNGSCAEPVNSNGTEIGRVTPLMVRSPVMVHSSPSRVTPVLVKVMSGYCSLSKKSPERRWSSRCCWPVLMLLATMLTSTLELAGVAVSTWAVPVNSLNWPRTVATIAWRALKPRRLCAGSMV